MTLSEDMRSLQSRLQFGTAYFFRKYPDRGMRRIPPRALIFSMGGPASQERRFRREGGC